jgi:hypothetical protein
MKTLKNLFWVLLTYYTIAYIGKWGFPNQLDRIEYYVLMTMAYAIYIKESKET